MSAYLFTPLPSSPVRDPNFVTPAEAQAVADSLLAGPVNGGTINVQVDGTIIHGVQVNPPVPNLYADGRIYVVLNFTAQMQVTNSLGRQQVITVPFSEVAGLLYDLVAKQGQPWLLTASVGPNGSWIGDVERAG